MLAFLSLNQLRPVWAHEGHDEVDKQPSEPAARGSTIRIPKESQFLLGIRTVVARARHLQQQITLFGRLAPLTHKVAALHAPVAGRITSKAVAKLGDRVRKGQVLVVVEQLLSTAEQIQLSSVKLQLEIEVERLETEIAQGEEEAFRLRAELARLLRVRDLVAAKTIQEAEIAARKAEKGLRGLKDRRSLFRKLGPPSIKQARIFPVSAPQDGVITEAHATFGEYVDPTKLLFRLVDTRTLWVEADVFEKDVSRVEATQGAQLTLAALPGTTYFATFAALGDVVDDPARTIKARFLVSNPRGRIKIGMFAQVRVDVSKSAKMVAVPRSALVNVEGEEVVFTHTAPEQFSRRSVVPGAQDGTWVALTSGLAPGERVVTQGIYQLKLVAERRLPRM